MKSKKSSLLLGAAHILDHLQPFFHIIKGSDRIHFFPADLLQLLFLLLIDIVQISCDHGSGICFIRNHFCRQVKPLIIPFFILFQPEIFVYGILGICKAVCDSSQVQRVNINACKDFRLLAAAPDAIPSFAVHNFNLILPDPVGKKDILRALHSDPVTFLFRSQLILCLFLSLCSTLQYIMKFIYLQDLRGRKAPYSLWPVSHTVHKGMNRFHYAPYHKDNHTNPNDSTDKQNI